MFIYIEVCVIEAGNEVRLLYNAGRIGENKAMSMTNDYMSAQAYSYQATRSLMSVMLSRRWSARQSRISVIAGTVTNQIFFDYIKARQ